MSEICSPEIVYKHYYDGQQNPYGENKLEVIGINGIAEGFTIIIMSGPDAMITIYDKVIGHFDDKTDDCFITFKILISMTRIGVLTRIVSSTPTDSIAIMDSCVSPDKGTFQSSNNSKNDSNIETLVNGFKTFSLAPLPAKQHVEKSYMIGKFHLTLNSQHKITQMGYVFKVVTESALNGTQKTAAEHRRDVVGKATGNIIVQEQHTDAAV